MEEARILLVPGSGQGVPVDVTEAVQVMFDAVHQSGDYGSGFLDLREVVLMDGVAERMGWERMGNYPDWPCAACGRVEELHWFSARTRAKTGACDRYGAADRETVVRALMDAGDA